jgi:hypothetical protein
MYEPDLSSKESSLFSFVVMRSIDPGCFQLSSWCLLDEERAHELGSLTFGLAGQKFLNIE